MTRGLDGVVMTQISYVCCTPTPQPAGAASRRSVERPGREARYLLKSAPSAGDEPCPGEARTPTFDGRTLANVRWLRVPIVSSKPTNPGQSFVRLWTGDIAAVLRCPRHLDIGNAYALAPASPARSA